DELLEYFVSGVARVNFQNKNEILADNTFNKIKDEIKNTLDLNKLAENGPIDKEIQNAKLDDKQKEQLQKLRIDQETIVLRYETLKNRINKETNVDKLRDLNYWQIQIINRNLPKTLKDDLDKKRKERLDYLVNQIKGSDFTLEDKNNLDTIRENRIDELKKTEESKDYNEIWSGISRETSLDKLYTNEYCKGRRTKTLQQERQGKLNSILKERELKKYDDYDESIEKFFHWK
ncbi:15326_t:CDS:2, partial [Racocetra persica]